MKHLVKVLILICMYVCMYVTAAYGKDTEVYGKISFISNLPKAEVSDYPNCNFTAIVNLKRKSQSQKIAVVFPGFRNRKKCSEAILKKDDLVKLKLKPYSDCSPNEQRIQLANDIDDIDLELFYAEKFTIVKTFNNSRKNIVHHSRKSNFIYLKPADYDNIQKVRKNNIINNLKKINCLLKQHGGDFNVWNDELKAFRNDHNSYNRRKWVGDSYFSNSWKRDFTTGAKYSWSVDAIRCIKVLNDYLKKRYIDLVVIPFPKREMVAADLLFPELIPADGIADPLYIKHLYDILKLNVEIIDLLPIFLHTRCNYPLFYFYNSAEFHPGEGAMWESAKAMSKIMARYNIKGFNFDNKLSLKQVPINTIINNGSAMRWHWPKGNPSFNHKEYPKLSQVINGAKPVNCQYPKSPFLLIGDSFILRPDDLNGYSIPSYLSYVSNKKIKSFGRASGARVILYKILSLERQGLLRGVRVCFFLYVPDYEYKGKYWRFIDISKK